ncbi:MAG: hypothetical protein ACD_7C00265G0007 [uncultured bacterium]|nr:MAG: hypothetical protein ACD_7C00265G0007 [uncultured bacterium]HBR79124.1 hypothetical protein [Candidatus Moranbacteria bacterium]
MKKKKNKKSFYPIIAVLLITVFNFSLITVAQAEIIFEDNFDNTPDWHSNEGYGGAGDVGFSGPASEAVLGAPLNWSSYSSSKRLSIIPSYNFQINTVLPKGGNGKSVLAEYETRNNWEGGRLVKWLGDEGYDDIIVRFSQWFEPGFKVRTMYGSFLHKMFRLEANVDNPQISSAEFDPTNMYQTPSSRPDWNNPLNVQPWGPYMSMVSYFTLNGDVFDATMAVVVNEPIDAVTSSGTLWLGDELLRYSSKDNTTRTFHISTRGFGGTPISSHVSGSSVSQSEFNLNSSNLGGKQSYVIFNYAVSTDRVTLSKLTYNPEGRAGSLSDLTTYFDGNSVLNWSEYFAERVDDVPGSFPWGAHNADGYDYQGSGEWVTWEVHVKMNTVGQEDGFVKIYVNNGTNPIVQKTGLALRKEEITKFNLLALPDNMYNLIYATQAGRLIRTGSGSVSPTFSIAKADNNITLMLNNNGVTEWTNTIADAGLTLEDLLMDIPSEWIWDGTVTKWTQSQIPIENIDIVTNNQAGIGQTYTYIPTFNPPSGMSDTQKFAIDDVIVYSPMSGSEIECGGTCTVDGRLPANYIIEETPGIIRSDVDNSSVTNTTDALLTLRNSLGLSMDGTAWQVGATTGDVDCSGTSNSTDALLILRYSLGLAMDGTSWCE